MATLKHSDFARDFSAKAQRALLATGVRIIGVQALTGNGSFANSQTGYCIDDNGTHRILTYAQIEALTCENVLA